MTALDDFLFFDIEYNPSTETIREYGFSFGDTQYRGSQPTVLAEAAEKAKYFVGHNILVHDAPIIKKNFNIQFPSVRALDTLMLSSLLFPRKPYHKLRKEYLHDENNPSDPLKDAELCKQLLQDCVEKWNTYPWQLKSLLYQFLKEEPGFAPFFDLVYFEERAAIKKNIQEIQRWFIEHFKNNICLNQNFEDEWVKFRTEWCYLITLFYEEGPSDFLPYWVRYRYPHVENILHRRRMVPCKDTHCPYCSENLNLVKQLNKWFNFPGFRKFSEEEAVPLQQQVAEAAMTGKSFLAVFPTGGGKSLTFQLPALIAGSQVGALTVVITPIVALMKDQVDVLEKRRNISKATYINSLLSPLERKEAIEAVYDGDKDILYISPESLRSNTTFNLLKHRRIARIVVDEAHCFSSWGHDFRVDYLYLADFLLDLQKEKKLEEQIPISCFTATAKVSVVDDICSYFEKRLNLTLERFISPAKRVNLTYSVVPASENSKERESQLRILLNGYQGPKIVYASKVKTTLHLSDYLKGHGFESASYNGPMDSEEKMQVQDNFQNGSVDTIVATTAFGMGVDKDNVELVAHYEISSTLENYVQEAGRAGRNPDLQAQCTVLYNKNDLNTHFQILQQSKLSPQEINSVWKVLRKEAAQRTKVTMSAVEIADKCGWTEKETNTGDITTKVKLAILVLEEQGFLKRNRNKTQMYGSSISVDSVEKARIALGENAHVPKTVENLAFRIIREIVSKRWTRNPECALDEMVVNLGITRNEANVGLRLLRAKNLLDEKNDWSLRLKKGNVTSKSILAEAKDLQKVLLKDCEKFGATERFSLNLSKLNSTLNHPNASVSRRSLLIFRGILRYWAHESVAEIHLLEAGHQIYQIEFLKSPIEIRKELEKKWTFFENVVEGLLAYQKEQDDKNIIWFSLSGLIEKIRGKGASQNLEYQKHIEYALLFLHLIGSVVLDKGLVVFYTGLVIEFDEYAKSKVFTEKDFELLDNHYKHKAQAIHIVGKYADLMLEDKEKAQEFLNDYFILNEVDFSLKYFLGNINDDAVSDEMRKNIENVNEEQRAVIRSRQKHILVGAGPGSGKTKLLVHKAASLLWIEKTKPDALLILTYTRAACRELKKRLIDLAGPLAKSVTISTFHALAFSILAIQGSKNELDKDGGSDVIAKAADLLKNGEDVGVGAPSVILVDEFQDLSLAEYNLLRALYDLNDKGSRIIVVGDDDQNIFSFRGGSSEFFERFKNDYEKTKSYYLSTNYRSCINLVKSSAPILGLLKNRIKEGVPQQARNLTKGTLVFYQYTDKVKAAFAAPYLAKELSIRVPGESFAILSRENAESYLSAAKLEELKAPFGMLKNRDKDKCSIDNIREIIGFRKFLEENPSENFSWSISDFASMKNEYCSQHAKESAFTLLDFIVQDYIDETKKCSDELVTLGGFIQHLSELTFADLQKDNLAPISVGTMHSAKGLEWDHVILNLANFETRNQEELRLLYVAATRAKKSVIVLGDKKRLPSQWLNSFTEKMLNTENTIPQIMHIETSLADVNLGHYLNNKDLQKQFEKMSLGTTLAVERNQEFGDYGLHFDNHFVSSFSKKFNAQISSLARNGYTPTSATISQFSAWTSDKGDTVWIPLLRVQFRHGNSLL